MGTDSSAPILSTLESDSGPPTEDEIRSEVINHDQLRGVTRSTATKSSRPGHARLVGAPMPMFRAVTAGAGLERMNRRADSAWASASARVTDRQARANPTLRIIARQSRAQRRGVARRIEEAGWYSPSSRRALPRRRWLRPPHGQSLRDALDE